MALLPALLIAAVLLSMIAPASAETRSLKLLNLHTREKAEIAFKRNGRYLPDGLHKINYILRDWRKNKSVSMDPRLLDLIWTVYQKTGSHEYINVVCGYRSPATNNMLRSRSRGVAKKSQHTLGKAMDFFIPGVPLAKLRAIGLKMEVGGVGYYPTSGSPFVHMDVGGVRHWPRMSRGQLLALFPNGRTIHIPSDGKPLPGYQQALAEYRQRNGEPPSVQVASASGRKHKGFFASLFGGGADEEEDNSEAVVVASAQKPRAKPSASSPLPGVRSAPASGEAADMPKLAAVALPQKAPRPDLNVGEPSPETQVAMNIPLPTWRPAYTPPAEPASGQPLVAAATTAYGTSNDQIAAVLARESTRLAEAAGTGGANGTDRGALQAFAGPLPTARPTALFQTASYTTLPEPRPEFLPETHSVTSMQAVLRGRDAAGKGGRVGRAGDSQRLALLAKAEAADPIVVVSSGVETTGKEARASSSDMKPKAKPVPVAVKSDVAQWAVQPRLPLMPVRTSRQHARAFDMVRSKPSFVYTAGFRQDNSGEDPHRFTGSAVKFLAMARFETN
ncbi:MAG: DUF882 domain-containing protein [Hyphomicrobiales bacterium]|nr:DUF882 domain-containing protein [Hyphomicrobiales bacterium]